MMNFFARGRCCKIAKAIKNICFNVVKEKLNIQNTLHFSTSFVSCSYYQLRLFDKWQVPLSNFWWNYQIQNTLNMIICLLESITISLQRRSKQNNCLCSSSKEAMKCHTYSKVKPNWYGCHLTSFWDNTEVGMASRWISPGLVHKS